MPKLPRIRTPLKQQGRRLRFQLLPALVFIGAVGLTLWLWDRHIALPHAVGEVGAIRADAISPSDGRLAVLSGKPLGLLDKVDAGQVIARLDAGAAEATMKTLEEELSGLKKQLEATQATIVHEQEARLHDEMTEKRRLTETLETVRKDILDREALIKPDKVQLARLNETLVAIEELVKKGVEPDVALLKARAERDVVKERIKANEDALEEAREQKVQSEERLRQYSLTQAAELKKLLAPLESAVETQKSRIKELELQTAKLVIRAPIAGTITAIHHWAGQNVLAGTPIVTIAAAEGEYVLSYVRQDVNIRPTIGMPVEVAARTLPRQVALSRVEEVGPQVEPVPAHQLRDPKVQEWGLPVRISLPAALNLRPGELVDVSFKPGSPFAASATAGDVRAASSRMVDASFRSGSANGAD